MFDNYKNEILLTYEKMRDESTLSLNLAQPTTAKLREECVRIYDQRYVFKDKVILDTFFTLLKDGADYRKIIVNTDPDEFKPLLNFLRKKTRNTDSKNIELLAWLIDFNPRPSTMFYRISNEKLPSESSLKELGIPEGATEVIMNTLNKMTDSIGTQDGDRCNYFEDREVVKKEIKQSPLKFPMLLYSLTKRGLSKHNYFGICLIFLLTISVAFFFLIGFSQKARMPEANERCMFWTGNHYEPINCNEKVSNITLIPLDLKVLKCKIKIESPDTLTKNSIGKVWYSSIRGKHEFFTYSGMHPTDSTKKLRPITTYILANHTSYYRYLLMILNSAICSVSVFILCAILIYRLRVKSKFLR